ncbi:MAG: hypothetical protein JNK81_01705 [Anaerolineales bacterium]|nr:hypothetical protein [Anaerolineales bacterium]
MGKNNKPNNGIGVGGDANDAVIVSGSGNKITIERGEGSPKNKPEPPKDKIDTLQWVFIIILFVFIIALIILFASNSSSILNGTASSVTETPTITSTSSPIPTDTVPPGAPTSTPIPPTDTPTFTPSPISPVPLGEDWIKGCISSVWRGYPSTVQTVERGDGCLQEPVHVFSAEFGDLDFLYHRTGRGESETYGLFAPLPESGTVTFTIRLRDLTNVDLLMGIFSQPDINSQGLLMIMLNGGVQKNVFIQKDPSNYVTIQGTKALDQGNGYSISFRFDNLSVISIVNPNVFVTNSVSVPSSQKWLFLGYKGLRDAYRIDGTFLNFELKP